MAQEMTPEQIELHKKYVKELITTGLILDKPAVEKLDSILGSAYDLMEKEYTTNEEKDNAFGEYKEIAMSFGRTLGETKYNFMLTEKEYKLMRKIIFREIEYDRQDLYFGLLVKDDFFGVVESRPGWDKDKFKDGVETVTTDINTITRLSHLCSMYKVKGLGEDAENFYEILKKITDISKSFEYYNNTGEQMSKDAMNWVQGLEEEEVMTEVVTEEPK